jgi:hypothetical protein
MCDQKKCLDFKEKEKKKSFFFSALRKGDFSSSIRVNHLSISMDIAVGE